MAINLGNLAQFGTGFAQGRNAAEDKKKRERQQLLAFTGHALQARQAGEDRAKAEEDRRAGQAEALDYHRQHDADLADARKMAADAVAENRKQNLETQRLHLKVQSLQDYVTGVGTGRYANMGHPAPGRRRPGPERRGGAEPARAGATVGQRPMNYGRPEPEAGAIRDAMQLYGGEAPAPVPVTVPYFSPTPDQVGRRAQQAATTTHAAAETAQLPQRLKETQRHNKASETILGKNFGERSRHDTVTEQQGAQRIDQGMMRVLQGDQRIGQGNQRLTMQQRSALGKAGADRVEAIDKRLTELSKPGKYNILTNSHEPGPGGTVDGKTEAAHLQNERRRLLSQPVDPVRSGMRIERIPGVGAVSVPNAPPLPGFAPTHHSQVQPRLKTGTRAGQFKKGAPNYSKMTTKQLLSMLGNH